MNNLDYAKINFDLLARFPNARRVSDGIYRVNPCPICNGKDHFTIYAPHKGKHNNPWWTYTSFNGCCCGGSPIDYLMEFENCSQEDAIKKITGNDFNRSSSSVIKNKPIESTSSGSKKNKLYDFSVLVDKLHKGVAEGDGIDYFAGRGLLDTTLKYKLGYHPDGYKVIGDMYPELNIKMAGIGAYKYFIPIWDVDNKPCYIIARHDNSIAAGQKTLNMKGLDVRLFNDRYLIRPPDDTFVFICEGWADALSCEEAGYKAIALNSTQNANNLLHLVKENKSKLLNKMFIIALDNDKAGEKAISVLEDGFKSLGISYNNFTFNRMYKDLNDFLVADRQGFVEHIKDFIENLMNQDFTNTYILELMDRIKANKDKPIISSGFPDLDNKLGGGVYSGLYCIGAGSSIGKTTFALQVADNIAASGNDVLFFSLEMSKDEMVSKSLVREIFKIDPRSKSIPSTRQFLNGKFDKELLLKAYKNYSNAAEHIAVLEGSFNTNVTDIRKRINEHIIRRSTKPVVFVDYLQVITPIDIRMSDKQSIDFNIVELKRISREFDIPVILISSVNRANYLNYISFESFKESGSIEYTCDVVIGLQLYAISSINQTYKGEGKLNEKRDAYNKVKAQEPRDIELVILKNRNGVPTATCKYNYYSRYNMIIEESDLTPVYDEENPFDK